MKPEAVTGSAVTYTVQLVQEQYGTLSAVYLLLMMLVVFECRKLIKDIVRRQNGGKR